MNLLRVNSDHELFRSFAAFAVKKLWQTTTSGEGKIPNPEGFEQMCSSFHLFMCDESLCEEFQNIVKKFNADISADLVNMLLPDLLMEMLSKLISNRLCSTKPTELSTEAPLSEHEEQITRYVAGFVGYKLKKHFTRFPKNTVAQFALQIVHTWQANPTTQQNVKSFLEYTNTWINEVNRGGLFQVRDDVFIMFRHMEQTCKQFLTDYKLKSSETNVRATLENAIDCSTAFNIAWDVVTQGVENTVAKQHLKERIIQAYVNIRCRSFCRAFMNLKKKSNPSTSQTGEKALRKKLCK